MEQRRQKCFSDQLSVLQVFSPPLTKSCDHEKRRDELRGIHKPTRTRAAVVITSKLFHQNVWNGSQHVGQDYIIMPNQNQTKKEERTSSSFSLQDFTTLHEKK